MQTRAAIARKAGDALSLETVELDGPREGEVLVEIKATGPWVHMPMLRLKRSLIFYNRILVRWDVLMTRP